MISATHLKIKALEAVTFPQLLTLTLQRTISRSKVLYNYLALWSLPYSTIIPGKAARGPTAFPSTMTLIRKVPFNFKNKDPTLEEYHLQEWGSKISNRNPAKTQRIKIAIKTHNRKILKNSLARPQKKSKRISNKRASHLKYQNSLDPTMPNKISDVYHQLRRGIRIVKRKRKKNSLNRLKKINNKQSRRLTKRM